MKITYPPKLAPINQHWFSPQVQKEHLDGLLQARVRPLGALQRDHEAAGFPISSLSLGTCIIYIPSCITSAICKTAKTYIKYIRHCPCASVLRAQETLSIEARSKAIPLPKAKCVAGKAAPKAKVKAKAKAAPASDEQPPRAKAAAKRAAK